MNDYEDDEIRCPFCSGSNGCRHLVSVFDHENSCIAGGIFYAREEEITELVRKAFDTLFASRGSPVGGSTTVNQLWEDFLTRKEDPEDDPLDTSLLALLFEELLRNTDAVSEGEEAVVAFFDPKPSRVYKQVVKAFQRACGVSHE